MNLQELKKIMELFSDSKIANFSMKQEGFELKLQKASPNNVATQAPVAPVSLQTPGTSGQMPALVCTPIESKASSEYFITSPMVGTFYRSPSPGATPYVNVGDTIKKGQTVAIIEAMKIMNEIEAEFDCKIIAIEVNDGQPVEFSTNLIKVEKL